MIIQRELTLTSDVFCSLGRMASLLAKFRIKYTSLTMIHNISDPPKPETVKFFDNIISSFRESNENAGKSK